MLDATGQKHAQQSEIADIFADFYKELYNAASPVYASEPGAVGKSEPVSDDEVKMAFSKLKCGKAFGNDGLMPEMSNQGTQN